MTASASIAFPSSATGSSPPAARPLRALLRDWLISFLGWGLVAAAVGARFTSEFSRPWTDAVMPGVRDWLPWAVLTPLIFRLTAKLPLDRQHWRAAVPAHLLACAAVMPAGAAWSGMVREWERGGDRFEGKPPPVQRSAAEMEGAAPAGRVPPPPRPAGKAWRGGPVPPGDPHRRGAPPGLGVFDLMVRLPVYLAILGAAHAQVFHRRSREREAGLTRARLEALSLRLRPHFLFNTLNTIAELVHDEPDKADAMLTSLSDLLRFSLETSREVERPLRHDLEAVKRYLAIMEVRFEERLRWEIDAPPETLDALTPVFLLQPLVENAVLHGVESLPGRRGVIRVQARREGARLSLTVSDNGPGLAEDEPVREGVGLASTRERLRELYGTAARLELCRAGNPGEGGVEEPGCAVRLSLPFRVTGGTARSSRTFT